MIRVIATLLLLVGTPLAQPVQTHGQAAGDPLTDTVSVWTRTSSNALVSVRYGSDPLLITALETGQVLVDGTTDHTVRVDLQGLQAGTVYYYRFRLADPLNPFAQALGPLGTFRTADPPATAADVTIAYTADILNISQYGLFASMAAQSPDLVLLLGDWPYADASPAATTLSAYRQKHRDARNEPTIQALLSQAAIAPIWDDHEIQNDWDAATDPARVALGRFVWKEYMPVRPNGDAVYRSLRLGQGVELFIPDTRTYRGVNEDADLPGRPLLGAAQLQWLQSGLLNSNAFFKLIATSVPLRYGTTNKDHYQGYMHERRQLLDWIVQHRIPGVVFLSGDQHWSAIHHHSEGLKEFQACPLATSIRPPPVEPEPEVVAIFPVRSFGVLRVEPALSPPRLTVEIHDAGGIVSSTIIKAEPPGRIRTSVDHGDGGIALDGAHRFRNRGEAITLPYAPAGQYTVNFLAPQSGLPPPDQQVLTLPPDGFISTAANLGVPNDPAHPELFRADFSTADLSAWTIVDEGATSAPSAWFQDDFKLVQSSNIYGGSSTATTPDKPGTYCAAGSYTWTDFTFTFRVETHDDDGIGAMFRLAANGSYYRFAMDDQRNFRRLTRTLGGVTTVLAETAGGYVGDHWYEVTIRALGPALSVALDGQTILTATDAAIPAGRIALYTWGSQVVWFDDVVVRQGDVVGAPSSALFQDDFSGGTLAGWTPVDQGTISAPSNWTVTSGQVVQNSNIYGGSLVGSDPNKPGTFLRTGNPIWADTVTSVRMRNDDNDGIGIMMRVVDDDNYYRFSMDSERAYRRLTRTLGGVTTILAQDSVSYAANTWYDVQVRAEGSNFEVLIDGISILTATDSAFPAGRIALYSWGSTGARFDDVVVAPVMRAPVSMAAHGTSNLFALDLFASAWPGRNYVLALSLASSPGIPLAVLDPNDPRVVPLVPDDLFLISLQPFPYFFNFAGTLDMAGRGTAGVFLPPGLPLAGFSFYASGIIFDAPSPSGIGAVLPALPVTLH